MNKNILIGLGGLAILIILMFIIPWSQPLPPEGSEGGAVMQQVEVERPAFQAGSEPLGARDSEYGFANEYGVHMYNGKPVMQRNTDGEITPFTLDVEGEAEGEATMRSPEIILTDEEGNELSEKEKTEFLNGLKDIYKE